MTWKPRAKKWDWNAFVTAEEAARIKKADASIAKIAAAREAAKPFILERRDIVNRAIQRAKQAAQRGEA